MADTEDTANALMDALYGKLILRDLFGKIVPGFLVLSCLTLRFDSAGLLKGVVAEARIFVWVVVVAISWLVALAVQSLGEAVGLIRFWPEAQKDAAQRYSQRIRFGRAATADERQQAERFALISEAAALSACASIVLIVEGLSLLVASSPGLPDPARDASYWIGITLFAAVAWGLLRLHRTHVQKRYDFMAQVLAVAKANAPAE